MKNTHIKNIYTLLLALVVAIVSSCTYTFPEEDLPTAGTADFTKVVAVGNSLTAGLMNGALYDAGQAASYANLVAKQIKLNGGGEFNQPDIDAADGYYGIAQGIPGVPDGTVLGRLHLKNPLNPSPAPIIPGQAITPFAGDKASLNNFGVPGMRIVDAAFAGYGLANPYFGRFASDPATATVLGDAISANGSFILFWLGNNDVLGYALKGATGDAEGNGTNPVDMTQTAIFDAAYNGAINALFTAGKKGIVANIPSVQNIPHFTTVTWNAIEFDENDPVDAGTIAALNTGYAAYNGGLDVMVGMGLLDQSEADDRYIVFGDGANGIVILDNSLTDLTVYNPNLVSMRMATSTDLITLAAGSLLPTGVGVSSPLGEEYTLIEADQIAIADRIVAFNAIIKSAVEASNGNLTLIDVNAEFEKVANGTITIHGAGINATISPPFGAFSLDGIHPNERGAAYIASLFIDKINEAFGANIPNLNPNNYAGNAMPVP